MNTEKSKHIRLQLQSGTDPDIATTQKEMVIKVLVIFMTFSIRPLFQSIALSDKQVVVDGESKMMRYNSFTPVPLDSNSDDTDMEDSDSEGEVQHTNGYSLLMQDESNNTNNQSAIVYSSDSEKEEDNYIQEHNKDLDLNDMDVVNAIVEEQLRQLEGVDLNHMGSRLLADAMEKLLTNAKVSSVPK
eukprot:Ihof_evm4s216 gene=Ihof_evmTU4s216